MEFAQMRIADLTHLSNLVGTHNPYAHKDPEKRLSEVDRILTELVDSLHVLRKDEDPSHFCSSFGIAVVGTEGVTADVCLDALLLNEYLTDLYAEIKALELEKEGEVTDFRAKLAEVLSPDVTTLNLGLALLQQEMYQAIEVNREEERFIVLPWGYAWAHKFEYNEEPRLELFLKIECCR